MAFKMNGWSAFTKATDARKFSKDNPPAVRREETNDGTPFAKETDNKPKVGQTYRSWFQGKFPTAKHEIHGPTRYWDGSQWTTEKPSEVDSDVEKQETKQKIFKKGVEIGSKILSKIKETKP